MGKMGVREKAGFGVPGSGAGGLIGGNAVHLPGKSHKMAVNRRSWFNAYRISYDGGFSRSRQRQGLSKHFAHIS